MTATPHTLARIDVTVSSSLTPTLLILGLFYGTSAASFVLGLSLFLPQPVLPHVALLLSSVVFAAFISRNRQSAQRESAVNCHSAVNASVSQSAPLSCERQVLPHQ